MIVLTVVVIMTGFESRWTGTDKCFQHQYVNVIPLILPNLITETNLIPLTASPAGQPRFKDPTAHSFCPLTVGHCSID